MKHVQQDRFGAPKGNCTEACIASLLEVPLSEVPPLYDPGCPDPWARLMEWLMARDRILVFGDHPAQSLPDELPVEIAWPNGVPVVLPELHLMGGQSPRGLPHMVVGRGGAVVWDPHPEGGGILDADGLGWIMIRSEVPELPDGATWLRVEWV